MLSFMTFMRTVKYGPYTIKSFPFCRKDAMWNIEGVIFYDQGGIITMQPFRPESSCLTEEHADIFGIDYAKRMIEGIPARTMTRGTTDTTHT